MEKKIVVAQCGRDTDLNILEEGKHLVEADWLENQPEGTGWFIPPWCPECEAEQLRLLQDPAYQAEIDAYICGPEFRKITDDVAGYVAYKKIMEQ